MKALGKIVGTVALAVLLGVVLALVIGGIYSTNHIPGLATSMELAQTRSFQVSYAVSVIWMLVVRAQRFEEFDHEPIPLSGVMGGSVFVGASFYVVVALVMFPSLQEAITTNDRGQVAFVIIMIMCACVFGMLWGVVVTIFSSCLGLIFSKTTIKRAFGLS